ncbi:peptide-methionine (S)-S-oxide reductase MsrA [Sediminicola luteus]|uniref:Peptide methionine sulfoxide reductase MsrA n=1 Tax=Sediminicola luteus TaxID=319238 RepID=A0ABV2TS12_9FLAO
MKMLKIIVVSAIALFSTSCQSKNKNQKPQVDKVAYGAQDLKEYETAYFASGCFWCVEAVFESVKGVKEVISGYAGGTELNPTYEQVAMGQTSHAEAVEVYYDPKVVSYETLVKVFFGSQDPTTLNRQGPDRGAQYRSVAFYKNEGEKKIIVDYIAKLTKDNVYNNPIVTEVTPFTKFYVAEDYHQDYERKHPNNPYIQGVSVPRLKRFQKKFPGLLKTDAH